MVVEGKQGIKHYTLESFQTQTHTETRAQKSFTTGFSVKSAQIQQTDSDFHPPALTRHVVYSSALLWLLLVIEVL